MRLRPTASLLADRQAQVASHLRLCRLVKVTMIVLATGKTPRIHNAVPDSVRWMEHVIRLLHLLRSSGVAGTETPKVLLTAKGSNFFYGQSHIDGQKHGGHCSRHCIGSIALCLSYP